MSLASLPPIALPEALCDLDEATGKKLRSRLLLLLVHEWLEDPKLAAVPASPRKIRRRDTADDRSAY